MNDCSDVSKDGCVEQWADNHHENTKAFFVICFRGHVAKAYGGHAGHREVERRQVGGERGRAPRDHRGVGGGVQRHVEGLVGSCS